ncbi:MAG: hypothetical protein HY973_02745 [Candidatus Kerfeldbacteria bacterium]|nr:hypothetical protein [Candidatus Kerfeldbacteria bacterium]
MVSTKLKHQPYLIITPQANNDLSLILLAPLGVIKQRVYKQGTSCETMIGSIGNFLKSTRHHIRGIVVCQSEASFSRQRLVMVVANTLAYALAVPALAVKQLSDYNAVSRHFKVLAKDSLIRITYSRPAVG